MGEGERVGSGDNVIDEETEIVTEPETDAEEDFEELSDIERV